MVFLHCDHIRSPILKIGDAVGNHRIGKVRTSRTFALQWDRPGNPSFDTFVEAMAECATRVLYRF